MMGLVLMILLWGGLVLLAVWLVRALFPSARQSQRKRANEDRNPVRILDRRYAQGEIGREEYDLMKETLSGEGHVDKS
jgi:putative membrane protein